MFWSTLGRMIVIPIAFVIAAMVAILVLLSLGYERIVQAMATSGTDIFEAVFDLIGHGAIIANGLTILPALALVIIGEVVRIRSALYYILGGGVALAAIPLLARFGQQADQRPRLLAAGWPPGLTGCPQGLRRHAIHHCCMPHRGSTFAPRIRRCGQRHGTSTHNH
jgi:hypothetical protein